MKVNKEWSKRQVRDHEWKLRNYPKYAELFNWTHPKNGELVA